MKLEEKIKQQQQAEPWLFRHGDKVKKKKSRMDIIGQNGNTGEHYEEEEEETPWLWEDSMPNARWNWYGEGEDQPVKMGPCSAHARDQEKWESEGRSDISKCWDQNEAARRKMNRHSAYNAKFWIYEEKRFGTWEESQEFYRQQDKKERLLRASSFLSTEEGRALRADLVGL